MKVDELCALVRLHTAISTWDDDRWKASRRAVCSMINEAKKETQEWNQTIINWVMLDGDEVVTQMVLLRLGDVSQVRVGAICIAQNC